MQAVLHMDPINRANSPRQGTQEAAFDSNKVLEVYEFEKEDFKRGRAARQGSRTGAIFQTWQEALNRGRLYLHAILRLPHKTS